MVELGYNSVVEHSLLQDNSKTIPWWLRDMEGRMGHIRPPASFHTLC